MKPPLLAVATTLALACAFTFGSFADGEPAKPLEQIDELPAKTPVKLEDLAFIAGAWGTKDPGPNAFEEHWSAPRAGCLIGMARFIGGGQLALVECQLIEQTSDGIILRIRHFGHDLVEKDEARRIAFTLIETSEDRAVFEDPENDFPTRVIYQREADAMKIILQGTNKKGEPREQVFALSSLH